MKTNINRFTTHRPSNPGRATHTIRSSPCADAHEYLEELEHAYHQMRTRLAALNDELLSEAILIDSLLDEVEQLGRDAGIRPTA